MVDSGSDYETYLSSYFNYPVKVIPQHLYFKGNEYLDGVDISKSVFYKEMLQSDELPKTSQPTPHDYYEAFKEEIDKGNKILSISLSSKLSGTYQSTLIARDMFPGEEAKNIYLIDSLNVSATIIILLMRANELLNEGKSLEEVTKDLEDYRSKVSLIALLDTLENLKKGGRVSLTQAAIGGLLNIKPLVSVEEGQIKPLDKFRGRKKGIKHISEFINDPANHIDKSKLFLLHSFDDEEKLKVDCNGIDLSSFKEVIYIKLGTTIGTHGGMNAIGLAYSIKD